MRIYAENNTNYIKTSDTGSTIKLKLIDNNNSPLDLTAYTKVEIAIGDSSGLILMLEPTSVKKNGYLEFSMAQSSLPKGKYLLEVHMTKPDNRMAIAPSKGNFVLNIEKSNQLGDQVALISVQVVLDKANEAISAAKTAEEVANQVRSEFDLLTSDHTGLEVINARTDSNNVTYDTVKDRLDNIDNKINNTIPATEKGKANGVAKLNSQGKVIDSSGTVLTNYTHPTSHPASIIVQDSNYRFVTDTEKATWNGKANLASPSFTGTPTAPTATTGTNTTQLATTAFVKQEINSPSTVVASATKFLQVDTRATNENPQYYMSIAKGVMYEFKANATIGLTSAFSEVPTYSEVSTYISWGDKSGGYPLQLAVNNAGMYYRNGTSETVWGNWNKIATTAIATTSTNGLMSSADKTKLNGIATGANNYVHPTSHPASMIEQSSNYRFVTDAQISAWNASTGGVTALVTTTTNGLMSSVDKVKLDGIASNANNYVHPTNHPPSIITQDSSNRFVTDAEKAAWSAKAGTSVATTSANGLMSSGDKTKLDSVATGANNYVHPTTHPASIIVQDSSNRFVSDTEKATWNAKASTSTATSSVNGLMSSSDKSKLDGIAAGANNYVHPTSHDPSIITQNQNNRFVTDTQISTWNGKYAKPSSGIPKTDLDSNVQASLAKADNALQSSKITISSSAPTGGSDGDIWFQY